LEGVRAGSTSGIDRIGEAEICRDEGVGTHGSDRLVGAGSASFTEVTLKVMVPIC
jgi:hypothetical protein